MNAEPAYRIAARNHPMAQPGRVAAGLVLSIVVLLSLTGLLDTLLHLQLWHPESAADHLDLSVAVDTLGNLTETLVAVLAVAVTVVAIVVELAANRYSHEITRLFLREPVNIVVLSLMVLTTVVAMWTVVAAAYTTGSEAAPLRGFILSLALATLSVLALLPYMLFVFAFLSPLNIIRRIQRDTMRQIGKAGKRDALRRQRRVLEGVDLLQDVARSAMLQGDRVIALAAVDALAELLADYARVRSGLPQAWFTISDAVRGDPDFLALAPEYLEEMQARQDWLEQKVLRRYLTLIGQASPGSRDVAYLIGINTARLAEAGGADTDGLRVLVLRAFNSYLRTTIGNRDQRTAYYLMHLYRKLASQLLHAGIADTPAEIARHIGEYGVLAHKAGMSFLLETAAYDLADLIEAAALTESGEVRDLLSVLLSLDEEVRQENQEESLFGVRRAQLRLATFFLERNMQVEAERIVLDLRQERLERLMRLRTALETDDRAQFWEMTDRGLNFAYLAPSRRRFLAPLFGMIQRQQVGDPVD
ncbi:MAG: DUF2254 domain-containing protein [Pseudomonadales bacterium]|nr:DUF2254 domain-containing protein [Pseudomonadales bacterium]MCP5184710.1 DUF2254 domain-containing protein [Pseudomonadales bacterium]